MKRFIAIFLIFSFTGLTAFAADPATTRDKTAKGAVIGAVAGGIIGAVVGNNRGKGNAKRGTIVGAVAGTAIGAGIGAMMDRQERELRQIEGVNVSRTADDELNVSVRNEVLFDFDSSSLRSSARSSLREMADV
ncbi:MAG: glycine zipper 2TM domain-containing protein, partial [Acidobacteriota bacterium]